MHRLATSSRGTAAFPLPGPLEKCLPTCRTSTRSMLFGNPTLPAKSSILAASGDERGTESDLDGIERKGRLTRATGRGLRRQAARTPVAAATGAVSPTRAAPRTAAPTRGRATPSATRPSAAAASTTAAATPSARR
jgi:hypothetical protein